MRLPDSCKAFWSHGTRAQAGAGILINRSFLGNFDEDLTHFETIQEGRIAVLRLNGPSGALDIWVVYLDACSHQERLHSLRRIAGGCQGQHSTLSVLAGDWNFVTTLKDRCCSTSGEWTGDRDRETQDLFSEILTDPLNVQAGLAPGLLHPPIRAVKRQAGQGVLHWASG